MKPWIRKIKMCGGSHPWVVGLDDSSYVWRFKSWREAIDYVIGIG